MSLRSPTKTPPHQTATRSLRANGYAQTLYPSRSPAQLPATPAPQAAQPTPPREPADVNFTSKRTPIPGPGNNFLLLLL